MPSLVAETDILRPLSPTQKDPIYEGDWEEFNLRNVNVLNRTGGLANLLDAGDTNLLIVRGELEKLPKTLAPYYQSGAPRKPTTIEINEVGRFAFGLDPANNACFWAAGDAGWFIVNPSKEYKPMFLEMSEAVICWYFVLDRHSTAKGKKSYRDIYADFARDHGITQKEAQARFFKHAEFLVRNMKKNTESISWGNTSFSQHLRSSVPEAFDTKAPQPKHEAARSKKVPEPTPELIQTVPQVAPKKRGRPPRAEVAPHNPATEVVQVAHDQKQPKALLQLTKQKADAALLWKFIKEKSHVAEFKTLPLTSLLNHIYIAFDFDNEVQTGNYVRSQAANLVRHMQEKTRRKLDWTKTQIYSDLLDADITPQMRGKMAKINLQLRSKRLEEDLAADALSVEYSSEEELPPAGHHTKSGLRPRKGIGAGKGKKGKSFKGKGPRVPNSTDSDDQGTHSGVATPTKRKFESEADAQDTGRLRKRVSRTRGSDEESIQVNTSDDLAETEAPVPGLAIRWKKNDSKSSGRTVRVQSPVDLDSNSPGDVWNCSVVGCMHTIYGASGGLGQSLIEQHIVEHEDDSERSQIDVVMREMGKTNLPVSNLIKRIRDFTAAQDLAGVMSLDRQEMAYPKPVRRLVA